MSWSVSVIGTAEKINQELDRIETELTGDSLAEFQEAKPHLQALIAGNVNSYTLLQLVANGHASFQEGKKTYGTVNVQLGTTVWAKAMT